MKIGQLPTSSIVSLKSRCGSIRSRLKRFVTKNGIALAVAAVGLDVALKTISQLAATLSEDSRHTSTLPAHSLVGLKRPKRMVTLAV